MFPVVTTWTELSDDVPALLWSSGIIPKFKTLFVNRPASQLLVPKALCMTHLDTTRNPHVECVCRT